MKHVLRMLQNAWLYVLCVAPPSFSHAQGLAWFTSPAGRFVVFDQGRFKELEPRTPPEVHLAGDALIYMTTEGTVKRYEAGRLDHLAQEPEGHLVADAGQVLLRVHHVWYRLTTSGPVLLAQDGGLFTLRDSLIAYHDRQQEMLMVRWKGNTHELATLTRASDTAQWAAGSNTVLWHERKGGRLKLFHRGLVTVLSDSNDAGIVSAGGDIAAWMDLGAHLFRVWTPAGVHDVEDLRPMRFQAGQGNVAYVSAAGSFKVWEDGVAYPVLDHPPTTFGQHDSLLVWVDQGTLHVLRGHTVQAEIPFIPETWDVRGATLVYLGLDRDLRRVVSGQEEVIWKRSGVRMFTLRGDAVLFRDADDMAHVWWNGRLYSY
ncbi:MAG: hypothetical protein JNM31_06235 [Flavobacteriales bacterium]|nr:hypothetical protein [Flavobacteriales bacterium]